MPGDLSHAAIMRQLDLGRPALIPTSARRIVRAAIVMFILGVGLLAVLVLLIDSTLSQGGSWIGLAVNLRVWALVAGIIGCLILAPIGVLVRLRRRVSLVISPDGISLARRGRILPEHLLAWHDVEEVVYERATTRGPKALVCLLTEEATRRLRGRGLNPRLLIRGGFVLSPRRLHPVLAAAHARFSAHSHGRR
ncbi:hypothetical protein [Brevibacterium renqingii]|uniref:hypothetical protein n=1 Tax=Brevibacterium renqingii TaxID=2776916 RepID=UPI001AE0D47C|nr:hypothetical protein [Brevibacterium renqingii]